MRKGVALVLMCLVAVGVLGVLLLSQQAEATTIVVPDDYLTIHEAVENASNGDRVYVKAGVYEDWADVNVSLILQGASPTNTTFKWNSSSPTQSCTIFVNSSNVLITGFNLTESDPDSASIFAWVDGTYIDNLTVTNCNFYNSPQGITAVNVTNVTIKYCDFTNSLFAGLNSDIVFDQCSNLLVEQNNFHQSVGASIIFEPIITDGWSYNATIKRNNFIDIYSPLSIWRVNNTKIYCNNISNVVFCAVIFYGDYPEMRSQDHIVCGNHFENCSYGDFGMHPGSTLGCFYIENSRNITIKNNYIYNSTAASGSADKGRPFTLGPCDNVTIYNNNFIVYEDLVRFNLIGNVLDNVTFDNGTIGNYWDNYTGIDDDGDGIGDTPFIVGTVAETQLVDNYPLMNPMIKRCPCDEIEPIPEEETTIWDSLLEIIVACMMLLMLILIFRIIIMTIMHQGTKAMK